MMKQISYSIVLAVWMAMATSFARQGYAQATGEVIAWGDNGYGQTNVPPTARSGVADIASIGWHSLALKNGEVLAWGYSPFTNVPVSAKSGVIAIAAGYMHNLALKNNGEVIAWGYNSSGQTNVPATAKSEVTAIAAGANHNLALKNGEVIAWGDNSDGQTNVPASAKSGVIAITAGAMHNLALKNNGEVVAWGYNSSGQTNVPTEAKSGVIAIAAGYSHSLALKNTGAVIAWGQNFEGQTNVPTAARSGVIAIAAGGWHNLALKNTGEVIAWGLHDSGQTNVPVAARSGVIAIAAGRVHSLAIAGSSPVASNQPPVLSWTGESNYTADGVNPDNGLPADTYVFRVKYKDADGDEPQSGYPRVHIKKDGQVLPGSPFGMSAADSGAFASGRIYRFSTNNLAAGSYAYQFEAKDAQGNAATGPAVQQMNGPMVLGGQIVFPDTPTNIFGGDLGGGESLSFQIACGSDAAWVAFTAVDETFAGDNNPGHYSLIGDAPLNGVWRVQTAGSAYLKVDESTMVQACYYNTPEGYWWDPNFTHWPLSGWRAANYRWVAYDGAGQERARGEFQLGLLVSQGGTIGTGRPVLLLHGILSDHKGYAELAADLAAQRPVYALDYPNTGSILESSRLLDVALRRLTAKVGDSKVHVVGHSMGGMLVRLYRQNGGGMVDRFVSVGSPFEGAPIANLLSIIRNGSMLDGISAVGTPAIYDIDDPVGRLGLWQNDAPAVVNDSSHLPLVGTDAYQVLTEEEYRTWQASRYELPSFDMPTIGSDGVVAWTSQGKRPLVQRQNIYIQAFHTGYFSSRKNRQYDKLVSAIAGFLANGTAILEQQPEYVQGAFSAFQVVQDVGGNQAARRMHLSAKASSAPPVQGAVLVAYDNVRDLYTILSPSSGSDGYLRFIPADAEALGGQLMVVAPGYLPVSVDDLTVDEVQLLPDPEDPLGALVEALDAPELVWNTGGDADWMAVSSPSHDGWDSAQSGGVEDNQYSWLQASVTGPGILSFWWRVSSETNYDFLELYVDGDWLINEISGETGWIQQTCWIPPGAHFLHWNYWKDDIVSDGFDCGWIDDVRLSPDVQEARMPYPNGSPWPLPGTVEFEHFDRGVGAYRDATAANEGGQYRRDEGVDIARDAGAGNQHVVGWTQAGEWLGYTVNVGQSGKYTLEVRVAAVGTGGQFRIWVDGVDKTGMLAVPSTGTWNTYQIVRKTGVELSAGVHTVWVEMVLEGASGNVGAFDWFRVTSETPSVQSAYPSGTPLAMPGTVEIENFDSGSQNLAYYDTTGTNEGGQYRPGEGVDISADAGAGNGYAVGWTTAGEWLEYTVNVVSSGTYALETRVAAVGTGGQFRILINGTDKTGLLNVPNTGAWNAYQIVQKTGVNLSSGIQTVRVAMVTVGTSGFAGAFDWFRVVAPPPSGQQPYNQTYTPWPAPDGVEFEDFDRGGEAVAYHDTTPTNQGGVYRTGEGVDIAADAAASNGYTLGWTLAGEWLEYTVQVPADGTYDLEIRVANSGAGATCRMLVDGADVTGTLAVPNTGGWNMYQVLRKPGLQLRAGVHVVRFEMVQTSSTGAVGAFDRWRLVPAGPLFGFNQGMMLNGSARVLGWGPFTNAIRIQHTPSLKPAIWTNVTGWITGNQYSIPSGSLKTTGFYRLEYQP